ncbi:mechanosensitive ion channel family protein [Roseivirga sp. E12]|uniref:mechanosensitive ion channel family protein n=1 Tax=Roseivirga sp. E12 TaxID=2819237 RepID=UPI001ABC1E36|nr:mechanosensitive ion channel domain-containing protein [Roseivirga sp. E12]MBO3700440.1 mechanosensitive ion channel family protein [Roseivirga sp. E12]
MSTLNYNIQSSLLAPLSNIGSGILLRLLKPFSIGDFIEIDGQVGSIERSGLQKTTIKKVDGSELKVNNSIFYQRDLHNLTSKNIIALDLKIGVSYQSNMTKVKEEIMTFFTQHERLLNSPKAKIQVSKIKNDFVELSIKPWCLLDDFLDLDAHLESQLAQYLVSKNVVLEEEQPIFSETKMLA